MNIPQSQNLHSQSFNSKFLEFVWRFDGSRQRIFKINRDGSSYMEDGFVDENGDWLGYTLQEMPNPTILNYGKYDNIDLEPELSLFRDEVVKYLNEI